MKLTNAVLVIAITSGTIWAQNGPVIIQGAKATADAAQQKQNAGVKTVSVAASAQSAKPAAQPAKPQAVKVNASQPTAKPSAASTMPSKAAVAAAKPQVKPAVSKPAASVKVVPVAVQGAKKASAKKSEVRAKATEPKPAAPAAAPKEDAAAADKASEPVKTEKTISANGRRDPFVSPVVSQSAVGSGCSNGKRCLAVDQISLKGVVKSETGMIAVVVNAMDKAYFLRENDPVFDGYVMKITGDSIVFKEMLQDKLGKSFTKEVTKKITAPVV